MDPTTDTLTANTLVDADLKCAIHHFILPHFLKSLKIVVDIVLY